MPILGPTVVIPLLPVRQMLEARDLKCTDNTKVSGAIRVETVGQLQSTGNGLKFSDSVLQRVIAETKLQ